MQTIQLSGTWKLRILGVLTIGLACLLTGAECKRSACWRYGHVCWGGHGKRSGQPPLFPLPSSNESGDEKIAYSPQWTDRPWKLNPKQTIPFSISNKPQKFLRQPLLSVENSNANGQSLPMILMRQQQQQLLNKQPQSRHLLNRLLLNPVMFEQNENDRNDLDDALIVPDASISTRTSSSHEILSDSQTLSSSGLKRSAAGEGLLGNVNGGGGTEEPLETSSNGLDASSVATFFRDRKSSGKMATIQNSGRKRFSNFHGGSTDNAIDFSRQTQFSNNIYDALPLSQYRSNKNNLPKTNAYY